MPKLKGKKQFLMLINGEDCIKDQVSGRFKRPDHQKGKQRSPRRKKQTNKNLERRVNVNGPR